MGLQHKDNFSIKTELPCQCEYCKITTNFLCAETKKTKIWPIRAEILDHIMNIFQDSDLPIDLSVEKKGSPHRLIMTKNSRLHQDAEKKFDPLNHYYQKFYK
ncbi:hypothetical protein CCS41_10990 [Candidatus Fukatsuia symbiotica]|uniref:Uncharacterized protein n=1 Tax=Candidatus Fukatsuia symbiotica TaxID=1878942 RepID=A0A2U8I6S9_9GAMM|nr:hypothetical protein CCS41_10990 [Candidatus Fukatsuia symbiotica]